MLERACQTKAPEILINGRGKDLGMQIIALVLPNNHTNLVTSNRICGRIHPLPFA